MPHVADQPEVLKLATQLKERGLNPWLDVWNLVAGEPWLPAVEYAIANSGACVVLVGPAGIGGVQAQEMWTAIEHSLSAHEEDATYRVIPTLLPHSTRGDRATLPDSSAAILGSSFRNRWTNRRYSTNW